MTEKTSLLLSAVSIVMLSSSQAPALSLTEGLAVVTARSWDVQAAASEEAAAAAAVDGARSGRFPRVDAFARVTSLAEQSRAVFAAGSSPIAETTSIGLGVTASQILWDFGRTGWGVASAEAGLEARSLDRQGAAAAAAVDFVTAYISVLEANRILTISDEEAARFEAHVTDAQALHREGVVTVNDVLIAEVNLADARQRIVRARSTLHMARSRLNYLLGLPLAEDSVLEEVPAPALASGRALSEFEGEARVRRPEVRALAAQVRALEAREAGLAADGYPVLTAGAGYEYRENRYQDPQDNWTLTAQATWTLYSGGRISAARRKSSAELALARARLEQASETAALEVTDAFTNREAAREGLLATEKSMEQARESLRLERAMYEEGVGTSSQVTDAVTRLARAEQTHWTALYALRKAEARLLHASGADLLTAYAASSAVQN